MVQVVDVLLLLLHERMVTLSLYSALGVVDFVGLPSSWRYLCPVFVILCTFEVGTYISRREALVQIKVRHTYDQAVILPWLHTRR